MNKQNRIALIGPEPKKGEVTSGHRDQKFFTREEHFGRYYGRQ
jgi:hypothetical protein